MSFKSFFLKRYEKLVDELPKERPAENVMYRAKQDLKVLEDMLDEGYPEIPQAIEENCGGLTRLRKFLRRNGEKPFLMPRKPEWGRSFEYSETPEDLGSFLEEALENASEFPKNSRLHFLTYLPGFIRWVGYEEDTAYVFLLRDSLLPYFYFKVHGRKRIHPWLLSRKSFVSLCQDEAADDIIRARIISALEKGATNFAELTAYTDKAMAETIKQWPKAEQFIREGLAAIKEKRIVVVESGCYGTFPLLLHSLDSRIDIKMYTAVPFLQPIFAERLFSKTYEKLRNFESICSQENYIRFHSIENGEVMVERCLDAEIVKNSLKEMATVISLE